MTTVRRAAGGLLIGLGLMLSVALPAAAQGERALPTGAARIVEKVEFRITVATIQLQTHVGQILENNAGVIPGK
jgi:hypothetical protein